MNGKKVQLTRQNIKDKIAPYLLIFSIISMGVGLNLVLISA